MKLVLKKHYRLIILLSIITLQIAFLITFAIVCHSSYYSEGWTRSLSRVYLEVVGRFNENLPFSVTEVTAIISIIFAVLLLAWGCCLLGTKKTWSGIRKFLDIAIIGLAIGGTYCMSSGIAYYRAPLDLKLYDGEINKDEFRDIATYFVNDYNACADALNFDEKGEIILPYSKETMIYKIRDEFRRLNSAYYNGYVPVPKYLATSGLFTSFGIVGMYFGPFNEANYSTFATNAELPFYICHELVHSSGVMREDDAQLVATYLMVTSEDPLFRFSGYYNSFESILSILHYTDNPNDYKEVKGLISDKVWNSYSYIYNHWKGKMYLYDLGNAINDWYLKTFGQKSGTSSYDDTEPEIHGDVVVSLSHYQKVYFKQYYDKNA